MERCVRCRISENEIRLFDAIYEGKMDSLCERCSIIENIPIIKKPDTRQLKESEKNPSIIKTPSKNFKNKDTFFIKDELNKLKQNPERELPEENKLNLIEHYHWEIMKNRRRKGLTQKQLASALGESEIAIQMIEKNKVPENGERLIKKLEQFFQIRLRKITEMERYLKAKEKEPLLLDENGYELETIPEPDSVFIEPEEEKQTNKINSYEESKELERLKKNYPEEEEEDLFNQKYYSVIKKPEIYCKIDIKKNSETPLLEDVAVMECRIEPPNRTNPSKNMKPPQDLDLRKTNLDKITINQLKDMHRRKVEVTRQERIEEQRKIEERQKIMEALRERDRIKQEEKRQQKYLEKEKIEMEKQKLIEERKRELQEIRQRESKDIDRVLGGSELLNEKNNKRLEDSENIKEFDEKLI